MLTLHPAPEVQILIGRTSQANGDIVSKLGKSDDWWLHVHQMPGSHVLVKSGQSGDLPNELLALASNLAVYFSSGRQSKNVPVVYTQLKHVRRIPGSYPGHVNYKHEKTVFMTPDEALIQPLLAIKNPPV